VRLTLLASPLLGPATWTPVAELLRGRGHDVTVPALREPGGTPADVLAAFLAATPDEPSVLVPHSNAGLYAAALAAERRLDGIVFVDAGLPADGPTTPTAPPAFRDFLGGLADVDGLLPPWTGWWADEDVDGLFPSATSRAAVEAEQPRLPLAYFDAELPSPPGWQALPTAYLAFGADAYAAELAVARSRGWPVEVLDGQHLHMLVDPGAVAGAVLALARDCGLPTEI
jgi:pimeloyl-ACP methyl ester carboxylesterase